MKIKSEIDWHEMARRFAIGEVNSQFFVCQDQKTKSDTLSLLQSGDRAKEEEGIRRHLLSRGQFMSTFPPDARWYCALLEIEENEFALLRLVKSDRPGQGWEEYSQGSYHLRDAARYLLQNPNADRRVTAIIRDMANGAVELRGITLLARSEDGPYTIAEGNARLVAIYINCVVNHLRIAGGDSIEVILGISGNKWDWPPV